MAKGVLHIREAERNLLTPIITELLRNRGIAPSEGLDSVANQIKVQEIVDTLRESPVFGHRLKWVQEKGEQR